MPPQMKLSDNFLSIVEIIYYIKEYHEEYIK